MFYTSYIWIVSYDGYCEKLSDINILEVNMSSKNSSFTCPLRHPFDRQ